MELEFLQLLGKLEMRTGTSAEETKKKKSIKTLSSHCAMLGARFFESQVFSLILTALECFTYKNEFPCPPPAILIMHEYIN